MLSRSTCRLLTLSSSKKGRSNQHSFITENAIEQSLAKRNATIPTGKQYIITDILTDDIGPFIFDTDSTMVSAKRLLRLEKIIPAVVSISILGLRTEESEQI